MDLFLMQFAILLAAIKSRNARKLNQLPHFQCNFNLQSILSYLTCNFFEKHFSRYDATSIYVF